MNIFITHRDPIEAAEYLIELSPKRARKIAVECSQILSETIRQLFKQDAPHGFQGNKTPLFWVMQNTYNFFWTYHYMVTLADRYNINCRKDGAYKDLPLKDVWENIIIQKLGMTNISPHECCQSFNPMCLCAESSIINLVRHDICQSYRELLKRKIERDKNNV